MRYNDTRQHTVYLPGSFWINIRSPDSKGYLNSLVQKTPIQNIVVILSSQYKKLFYILHYQSEAWSLLTQELREAD